MKNHKIITLTFLIVVAISGCATRPPVGDSELSDQLLDVTSSVITVDTAASEPLILSILNDVFPEDFQEQILPDTDKFILLLYPESAGGGFILISQGNYSRNRFNLGLFFQSSWKRRFKPVKYWDNMEKGLEISILSPFLMVISNGHIAEAVKAVEDLTLMNSPKVSAGTSIDAGGSGTMGQNQMGQNHMAPLSLRMNHPELFLTSLSEQYPELAAGIEALSLDIYMEGEEISINGTITCKDSDFADMSIRPFKIMILAEAKKTGMELMRKTLTGTSVETSGTDLVFANLPMDAGKFRALVEGMLIGIAP